MKTPLSLMLVLAGVPLASAQPTFIQNFDTPNFSGNVFNEKNNPFGYTYTKVGGDTMEYQTWLQPSDGAGPFQASRQPNGVTGDALNFTLGNVNLANPSGPDVGGFGGGFNWFSGDTATTPPTAGTPKVDLDNGNPDLYFTMEVATVGDGFTATIKDGDLSLNITLNDNTISQAIYNGNDSQFVAETLILKFTTGVPLITSTYQTVRRRLTAGTWSFTNGSNTDGSPITTTTVSVGGVSAPRTPTDAELKEAFPRMVQGKRQNGTTDASPPTGPNLYSFIFNVDSGTASDFFNGAGLRFDNIGFVLTSEPPVIRPNGGSIPVGGVVLDDDNDPDNALASNVKIYYTTNGDTPTASSTPYTGPITLGSAATLKAVTIRVDGGGVPLPKYVPSLVASADFSSLPSVQNPVFNPPAGEFRFVAGETDPLEVSITTGTDGATIYYTTNGTDPDDTSSVFNPAQPIQLSTAGATTIKAIAAKDGMNASAIVSATYTLLEVVPALPDGISKLPQFGYIFLVTKKPEGFEGPFVPYAYSPAFGYTAVLTDPAPTDNLELDNRYLYLYHPVTQNIIAIRVNIDPGSPDLPTLYVFPPTGKRGKWLMPRLEPIVDGEGNRTFRNRDVLTDGVFWDPLLPAETPLISDFWNLTEIPLADE